MDDKGVLDSAKEGAIPGAFIGFTVGASRTFLASGEASLPAPRHLPLSSSSSLPSLPPASSYSSVLRSSPIASVLTTSAIYASLGAAYLGSAALARNLRDKDDMWNRTIGAAFAGSLVGLRTSSIYVSGGAAASLAFAAAASHLLNGRMGPQENDPTMARRRAVYGG